MKKLFEEHQGEVAMIVFTNDGKMEGRVANVFDDYVVLETYNSGPERYVYVSLSALVRVHFKPAQVK